jgi:hypothetical protein
MPYGAILVAGQGEARPTQMLQSDQSRVLNRSLEFFVHLYGAMLPVSIVFYW